MENNFSKVTVAYFVGPVSMTSFKSFEHIFYVLPQIGALLYIYMKYFLKIIKIIRIINIKAKCGAVAFGFCGGEAVREMKIICNCGNCLQSLWLFHSNNNKNSNNQKQVNMHKRRVFNSEIL